MNFYKELAFKILFLLRSDRRKLPFLIFSFLFLSLIDISALAFIGPYVSLLLGRGEEFFFDFGIKGDDLIVLLSLILFLIFLFKLFASLIISYLILDFSETQTFKIRTRLMSLFQNLPFEDFLNKQNSEYVFKIGTAASYYAGNTLYYILRLLSDFILVFLIFAFLAYQNTYAFFVISSLLISFVVLYNLFFQSILASSGEKANKANNKIIKVLKEAMSGLKEIRILKKERFFYENLEKNALDYKIQRVRGGIISQAPKYIIEFIFITFIVILVSSSIFLNQNIEELFATIVVFVFAGLRLIPLISSFSSSLSIIKYNLNTVDILYEDFYKYKNIKSSKNFEKVEGLEFENIRIEELSFSYLNNEINILKNINISIDSGLSVGIVGKSGSGKTTLIDLMLGLLTPKSGLIFINDKPLKDIIDLWRNSIAYLPQDVFLIDDSLKSNIALGEENVDEKKLQESLEKAKLDVFVKNLPNGVETSFGDEGSRLSGGQRQRVALARAFYKEKKILFLDESTSSLDAQTEQEINNEITSLGREYTKIIISHKESSLVNCDLIIKLHEGEITKIGSPSEVFNK